MCVHYEMLARVSKTSISVCVLYTNILYICRYAVCLSVKWMDYVEFECDIAVAVVVSVL